MKSNKIKIAIAGLIVGGVMITSCKKDITDLNENPNALSAVDALSLKYVFSASQYYGIMAGTGNGGTYQLFQSLFTDQRAQYFSCVQTKFPSDRNIMVGSWLNRSWDQFYIGQSQLAEVLKHTAPGAALENPTIYAIAQVWKVYTYQLLTDAYGPLPYSEAGNKKNEVLFDGQREIYMDFIKTLRESSVTLSQADAVSGLGDGDLIYGGDTKKWLRFANSLRLRIALRISAVEPAMARKEAEEVTAATGGLLQVAGDNAFLKVSNNTPNPLAAISNWGEFRMSAAMQSILQGYDDPRLPMYFSPAKNSGKFKGVRNGLSIAQMQVVGNTADDNSNLAIKIGFQNKGLAPFPIMVTAETYFLLAEAKLKGWFVGQQTAKQYYELGVKASMEQWGIENTVGNAYVESTRTPAVLGDMFQTPALTDIPVKFSASADKQLEQIITQKWLALFPQSPEAWAEYRRTGFPKLYPRINNENPEASTDPNSVHRLTYPPNISALDPKGYASAVEKLGGKDNVQTRVWWDVNAK